MSYPTTFGTNPSQQSLGPQTIPVYASLAALSLETNVIPPGAMAAVQNPTFTLYQAAGSLPANGQFAASSTSSSQLAGGDLTVYWQSVAASVIPSSSVALTARAVMTSIGAYTGSGTGTLTVTATGALAAQDGLTLVAGDQVFLQAGTTNVTAKDSGPFVVVNPGATGVSAVLSRPSWFLTGNTFVSGQTIKIGGQGNVFKGTEWFISAANGVIDTTDAAFFCRAITIQATLVAGTLALTVPVGIIGTSGSASTQANCLMALSATGGTLTGTVSYGCKGLTAGYKGTSAASAFAFATALATQTSDTSTLNVTFLNVG